MKKLVSTILLAAFVAAPALADDNTGKSYFVGDLGRARYSGVDVPAGTYPNPGMIRVGIGYHFSPTVSAEIGYSKFGDSVITLGTSQGTITASSIQIAAIGSIPLNPQFDFFGKIGAASNSQKLEVTTSGTVVGSASDSASNLLIGVGAQFHVNPQFSLRAQIENFGNFGKFGSTGNTMTASAFSLGVVLDF
jgi:OOP family OmpA-OmpF porin